MNKQNIEKKPAIRKETKNKIRVDFERTSLKERLKAKFLNFYPGFSEIAWKKTLLKRSLSPT